MRVVLTTAAFLAGVLACIGAAETEPTDVRAVIEARNADFERWYAAGEIDSAALNCVRAEPIVYRVSAKLQKDSLSLVFEGRQPSNFAS